MLAISGPWLTAVLCMAEVLTMTGFSTYAVVLAPLRDLWSLNNADAGFIVGMFFAGYTIAVPFLVSMTDRIDPRRIWLTGASLTVLGFGGFGLLANGLASAAAFQALAGAGLAGTYMPGLRLLADHLQLRAQSRAVALYTASFGIGTASSYLIADHLAQNFGWRAAFLFPAGMSALAALLVCLTVRASRPVQPTNLLLGLRIVLRQRSALAYSIAYLAHSWELYAARSWLIAFLSFVAAESGRGPASPAPAQVAFGMAVLGILTILLGSECSIRFGRKRTVTALMCASAAAAAAVGIVHGSYAMMVVLVLLHGALMTSESASVTAGALGNAAPGHRGATLALHSMLGFAGGAIGPVIFGVALDLAGGAGIRAAWAAAYIVLAVGTLLGPAIVLALRPHDLQGDRPG